MKRIIIALALVSLVLMVGCKETVDNPEDCKNVFKSEGLSQKMANSIYRSPNCFSYGVKDDGWFVECCMDEGVTYSK